MTTLTDAPERVSARERLLAAADALFYGEGVNTVGIDRVIAAAGVAKASLYKAFGSKEELIREYLARRHAARIERLTRDLAPFATPRERLRGFFTVLAQRMADPDYRGCAFIRASAEQPVGPLVAEASALSRAWLRGLLTDLARAAGAADPAGLAAQLALIYDGAGVAALMEQDRSEAARAVVVAAEAVLAAAGV
jgi:AcrR family transcriptional regulator